MKKTIFILCLLWVWYGNYSATAQVTDNARFNLMTPGLKEWFPGWYITSEGDTLSGYVYLSNQIENQQTFKFSMQNEPHTDAKTLTPQAAKGFRVKDRVYESFYNPTDKSSLEGFVRRIETGQLSLYTWFSIPANGTLHDGPYDRPITATDEKWHEKANILRMGDGSPMMVPEKASFAKVMSDLIADDKELSNKVAQKLKGYRNTDILNIVQEYNRWYKSH